MCAALYAPDICKDFIGYAVDIAPRDSSSLLFSPEMICGYYFDLCSSVPGAKVYVPYTAE